MKNTFEYDNNLPSLPLPTLKHTLERYLDSVRAVVNDDEYARTKKLVEEFAQGNGRELHEQLKNKIENGNERNWLAQWWDEIIYFRWRLPIAPAINMMGVPCTVPPENDSQVKRISTHMHACALVFQKLREERYPISYMGQYPLTMYQYKHYFNTCRIPHKDCDELVSYFRTVSEDPNLPPTHVIVIRNGRFFTFDLYESNRLLSPSEIRPKLENIMKQSDQYPGLGLGALTALPRDEWAEIRDYICELNEQNRINLKLIESALIVYAFDNENVANLTELGELGMLKNPESRWFDRSNLFIVSRNGLVATNGDHSAFEGIVPLQIGEHIKNEIDSLEKLNSYPIISTETTVQELLFMSDSRILNAIHNGINLFNDTAKNIEILVTHVEQCTKEDIKKYVRIHPDIFFQLCLQLAYYRINNSKPAATYETASTRRFYRGRTETMRSCTPEVVTWCQAMTNSTTTERERRKLFLIAANRHGQLILEASDNQGCDRHLFGLSMIAYETGKTFELTDDPSWIKSGGSGNFILSTSCLGFGETTGGTSPMCLNGYGVFYRIGTDAITFVVSAFRSCPETNVKALTDSIQRTLIEVKTSFITSNL